MTDADGQDDPAQPKLAPEWRVVVTTPTAKMVSNVVGHVAALEAAGRVVANGHVRSVYVEWRPVGDWQLSTRVELTYRAAPDDGSDDGQEVAGS